MTGLFPLCREYGYARKKVGAKFALQQVIQQVP